MMGVLARVGAALISFVGYLSVLVLILWQIYLVMNDGKILVAIAIPFFIILFANIWWWKRRGFFFYLFLGFAVLSFVIFAEPARIALFQVLVWWLVHWITRKIREAAKNC